MAGRGRGGSAASAGIRAFGNSVHRPADDPSKKRKEVGEHHDGSFGVYMSHKIQKLRRKNTSFVDSTTSLATDDGGNGGVDEGSIQAESAIFQGVHVYVDGYTTPSKEEIRSLMLLHGGGFEHYETSLVTHIIATHLATSKLLQLKKMKKPTPVVRPEWIVKSIEANKLLPIQPFVYKAFGDPTQSSVLSLTLSASGKSQIDAGGQESDSDDGDNVDEFSESEEGGSDEEEHHEALASQYEQASQHGEDDGTTAGPTTSSLLVSGASRTNSTRDGPSFVRHFFAKSRLHHIGSWRFTFQQRAHEFAAKYKGPAFTRAPVTSTERVILHVDMDCFFVAVAVRDKPQYQQNVPVAIAHSGNAGTSEISSCNYVAREKGLRAGMFMQSAKELCPELIVLPYQFDEIQECSFQIYDIFFSRTPYVQAMSCDEAYLEFASGTDGEAMARDIRQAIYEKTRCTASVGVSYNILLAKLATREAKPNGYFRIGTPEQATPFLQALRVRDLPGVGHRMGAKMSELGIESLESLKAISKSELQKHFGNSASEMLFNYARGVDLRPLSVESNTMRKSVSAVVNFGIRFEKWEEATEFMMALADEMSTRLKSLNVSTKCLTLLIKKRREGAPVEPAKFMGMGSCDSYSRSQVLSEPTDSDLIIGRTCIDLLRQLHLPVQDLRGVGIQATKLVGSTKPVDSKAGERFRAWLVDPATTSTAQEPAQPKQHRVEYQETLSQIDNSVLNELPPDIRDEILAAHKASRRLGNDAAVPTSVQPTKTGKGKKKLVAPTTSTRVASNFQNRGEAKSTGFPTALNDIRLSQVDDDVYKSLPLSIRKEINIYAQKRSSAPGARPAARSDQPTETPSSKEAEKAQLSSIEDLVHALISIIEFFDAAPSSDSSEDLETRVYAAFDAIFSRVLVEIYNHSLDSALRMLRFVRRKCSEHDVTSAPTNVGRLFRDGFNHVLQQINTELRQSYRGVFSSRLVPPL